MRTVPVNHSSGPLAEGCVPALFISILYPFNVTTNLSIIPITGAGGDFNRQLELRQNDVDDFLLFFPDHLLVQRNRTTLIRLPFIGDGHAVFVDMIAESIGAETGRNGYFQQIAAVGTDGINKTVFCRLRFLDGDDDGSLESRRLEEDIFILVDFYAPVGIAASTKDFYTFGAAFFPGSIFRRGILAE